MKKLTSYLTRLFATDALVLFVIVCVLLWLVNCLRSFELVSVKGQGIDTLALQAFYAMPPLALSFFYICVGIGMARGLTALQNSHELHIVHTSHGLRGLWSATIATISAASLAALFLSHIAEPWANRQLNVLSASVAADLVSSTLKPNRFTQATPGVVHVRRRNELWARTVERAPRMGVSDTRTGHADIGWSQAHAAVGVIERRRARRIGIGHG